MSELGNPVSAVEEPMDNSLAALFAALRKMREQGTASCGASDPTIYVDLHMAGELCEPTLIIEDHGVSALSLCLACSACPSCLQGLASQCAI